MRNFCDFDEYLFLKDLRSFPNPLETVGSILTVIYTDNVDEGKDKIAKKLIKQSIAAEDIPDVRFLLKNKINISSLEKMKKETQDKNKKKKYEEQIKRLKKDREKKIEYLRKKAQSGKKKYDNLSQGDKEKVDRRADRLLANL